MDTSSQKDRYSGYQSMEVDRNVKTVNKHNSHNDTIKFQKPVLLFISFFVLVFLLVVLLAPRSVNNDIGTLMTAATQVVIGNKFDSLGRYVMENFDDQKPMSSFLPGIAGIWGIPMWAFYVNRGQAIASFGTQNKDGGIMKFSTANVAYQQTPNTGFRTFLKGSRSPTSRRLGKIHKDATRSDTIDEWFHMPFQSTEQGQEQSITTTKTCSTNELTKEFVCTYSTTSNPAENSHRNIRNMMIGSNELEIEEMCEEHQLKTNVLYFTLPEEDFPALIRQVTFTNTDTDPENGPLSLDILDGMARLVPAGLTNGALDGMGRTMEAWMNVYNSIETSTETSTSGKGGDNSDTSSRVFKEPFFHVSQAAVDTAKVQRIFDGNFAVSFLLPDDTAKEDESELFDEDGLYTPLPYVIDPDVVFNRDTTLSNPEGFVSFPSNLGTASTQSKTRKVSTSPFFEQRQGATSRTPCAFTGTTVTNIPPNSSVTIISVYGHAVDLQKFTQHISKRVRKPGFLLNKRKVASQLVDDMVDRVATSTSSDLLNAYVKQNFLDCALRGGFPVQLSDDPSTGVEVMSLGESKGEIDIDHLEKGQHVSYVYSRIHGDLERDYNQFQIDVSYFSQGPGNFRDVNQNRRSDVRIVPSTGDFNIRKFLELVQADGYNPLTVASPMYTIPAKDLDKLVTDLVHIIHTHTSKKGESKGITSGDVQTLLSSLLSQPFRMGQLFLDLKNGGLKCTVEQRNEAVIRIGSVMENHMAASFAQNGFWTDHWTYILDLFDSYLSVYPDNEEHLLFDSKKIGFFMSPAVVLPRSKRYQLEAKGPNGDSADDAGYIVRVYRSVSIMGVDKDFPQDRADELNDIYSSYVHDAGNAGNVFQRTAPVMVEKNSDATNAVSIPQKQRVFQVSIICKLFMLSVLKFTTMDAHGLGVEMEGGKPGWNDALNGLPSLLGSSMPETYETIRLLKFLKTTLSKHSTQVVEVPEEFGVFLMSVKKVLIEMIFPVQPTASTPLEPYHYNEDTEYEYWDKVNTAREQYRESVSVTFSGVTQSYAAADVIAIIGMMYDKAKIGVRQALLSTADSSGLSPTYFYFDCTNYSTATDQDWSKSKILAEAQQSSHNQIDVMCLSFKRHSLPLFLEGPVRQLRIIDQEFDRRIIYNRLKQSSLYDETLQMYLISESLKKAPEEIGRVVAFSPGWLENESVWLHMSYKYYLELLRGGLYDEFYGEISTGLVPFMDAAKYGRSPLEAASFIVSSAFPDNKLQGAGFLARLSGATAEFLSMWGIMMASEQPFTVSGDGSSCILVLKLRPSLPAWLFHETSDQVSFIFLGSVNVTYHNSLRLDSWTLSPISYKLTYRRGTLPSANAAPLTTGTSYADASDGDAGAAVETTVGEDGVVAVHITAGELLGSYALDVRLLKVASLLVELK